MGPTVRDGVIVYDTIASLSDLPAGWTDEQRPGHYRLARRRDGALFGFTVPAHSWKPWFLPPRQRLATIRKSGASLVVEEEPPRSVPLALLGARACELAAIAIQDKALNVPGFAEPHYHARRGDVFVVAVECAEARGTCFCASMDSGPAVRTGYDLALCELVNGGHRFVARAGSDAGHAVLERIGGPEATADDVRAAAAQVAHAAATMGRTLDRAGLAEALQAAAGRPEWEAVGQRCLGCTSCTLVCPTCFCTTLEDTTDLAGAVARRERRWDSCFTLGFSYVFGGPVRQSLAARYRQWLTHKLSSWRAQYGTDGCVGCGRCITWCPAGIDMTAEAGRLREVRQ